MSASLSAREAAALEVARLTALLAEQPQEGVVPELIELGQHLERAVRAFHMEAIRFRAFTMGRLVKQHIAELPAEVPAAMEAISVALEAAGFHTRSVNA